MDCKRSVAAAVVVYNVHCADSLTCQALAGITGEDLTVLIYDNSTKDLGNRKYCEERGWTYLGGNGNAGISKAYNECVDHLTQSGTAQVLCVFDDDTALNGSYFTLLREAMEGAEERIFVPLIYSNDKLLSPCRMAPGHSIRLFETEEQALECREKNLSAINSCMAMNLSLFDSYRYDENIFLDGVDHHFIADMVQRGERIKVFAYRCRHSFSGDSVPSKSSALSRFRIFEKDFRYILRNDKPAYLRLVGKRVLKLTLQYRSVDFLRALLRRQ